jgi:hypothetical protein
MAELLGEQGLEAKLNDIYATMRRMDIRFDRGLIVDEEEYFTERLKLQQEVEKLTPVASEDLEHAADYLTNFSQYWADCAGDVDKQHELIKLIVERVYLEDEHVVAMTLKSNYHLVLGHKTNEPTSYEIDPFISSTWYAGGDDGLRLLTGAQWMIFVPPYVPLPSAS